MPPKIEDFLFVVDETIVLQDSDGAKRPGKIVLGAPVFCEGDERWPRCWHCHFRLDGLTGTGLIAEMSSLHSLLLAWRFIQYKLDEFLATGGEILYENGKKNFYLPDIIRLDFFDQRLFEVND